MIFVPDRIGQQVIYLFRKRKKTELGIIKEPIDKMELYQDLLLQQFCFIEKDLMILDIIDIDQLERRHAYLPDHLAGRRAEGYIVRSDDRIGQVGIDLLLRQHLVREVKMVLIDKTSVKILLFPVECVVMVIRQEPVLRVLFHSQN